MTIREDMTIEQQHRLLLETINRQHTALKVARKHMLPAVNSADDRAATDLVNAVIRMGEKDWNL